MKRKRRFALILAACGVVVLVVAAFWPGEKEPSYQGKTLTEWLDDYNRSAGPASEQAHMAASDAVRHIGTNALPCVLRWISYSPPSWKVKLDAGLSKLPPALNGVTDWVDRALVSSQEERSLLGYGGTCLRILGRDAEPAIPELVRLAKGSDQKISRMAMCALGQIGEKGIASLGGIAGDLQHPDRDWAIGALSLVDHTNANQAVAIAVRFLGDEDSSVAATAAEIVGELRGKPAELVPALVKCVHDPRPSVRANVIWALGRFYSYARVAAPELQSALNDSSLEVRKRATNALEQIGPEVLTNGIATESKE